MIDLKSVKLGKLAKREDRRTLKLKAYLPEVLPTAPVEVDFAAKVTGGWPMYLNDQLGDCAVAAAGHLIEQWTANAGKQSNPQDLDILSAYESIGKYDPSDTSTDNGCVELDVLNYWRNKGIGGHKIGAFAEIAPLATTHVKLATYLFGGLYIGLQLPISAQTQGVWDVSSGPDGEVGSWGGHAVEVCAYDTDGITCVTWGQRIKMTWAFWAMYVDEVYAIISQDFISGGKTPEGFDLATLVADLKEIG